MTDKIIKSVKFLPEFLQTGKNAKFLSSTIDQLIQKPQLERLDGYIGSTGTNYRPEDVYITESSALRENYQLAPSLVVKDADGNVKDVLGINDLVNEIAIQGGTVDNFDKLFKSQYYSYNPHIDSDKFINYQNYYWLVNGPLTIDISSAVDVELDILGKESYVIPGIHVNGLPVSLMNGMKIRFTGTVSPDYYNNVYYVDGVGNSIVLVNENTLKVAEKIAAIYDDSFDGSSFDEYPFDSYTRLPINPDYITINRSSQDLNPWSRYNRWIHKDVIEISSAINDVQPRLPAVDRAKRPIIEFVPNIKLYNFGTLGLSPVDVIDTVTADAFSIVEGTPGYFVDGVLLQQGDKVIFTADTDVDVRGKVYEVNYVTIDNNLRLTLVESYAPNAGNVTYVNSGNDYEGTSWWFDGDQWKLAQQHDKLNQAPLFDLFDADGISYTDSQYYNSNFVGNKIFGYSVGVGAADPVLGFALDYRNSIGVGSYLFKNYLTSDTFTLTNADVIQTISTGVGFIKIGGDFFNAWSQEKQYPVELLTSYLNTASTYYDLPLGLTNNPLNGSISTLTLSDYRDHVSTSSESRLVSNVNPLAFALMFIAKKEHSVVDAVTKVADQYNNFKLAFIKQITDLSIENDPVKAVDEALKLLNISKTEASAFYLSDMVAYGDDYKEKIYTVNNANVTAYPLISSFDPTAPTLRSILIYLNGSLLTHGVDYSFAANDIYVYFHVSLSVGDVILIKDYASTEGSYIPPTPTKLGLFPKYQPRIYVDNSYLNPVKVIEGHDGSIVVAFDDYRDDIILELEKRIYNNIKAQYRSEILDINSVLPGAFRTTAYSSQEINGILQQDFVKWSTTYGLDPTINSGYDLNNSWTWNYTGSYIQQIDYTPTGSWRSVYRYLYDTDRPDLRPWEMLGFSEEPNWWVDEYGVNPYSSTSTYVKLWTDLEQGRIRQGDREGIDSLYARPGLASLIPVDTNGTLEPPSIHVINVLAANTRLPWEFGNWGEVETAWRRSSNWPFTVQKLLALTRPSTYAALLYDPIRLNKNVLGQWVYGDNREFLNLKNMPVQGLNDYPTSGYSVFVAEVGRQRSANYNNELQEDLSNLDINLFYKVGGFIDKSQLQISIDAFDPLSKSPGSLLQPEDYTLILNVSNPIRETSISGIFVQKRDGKFLINGLDYQKPYFTVYKPLRNATTPAITVGGVSENYLVWEPSTSGGNSGLTSIDTTSASATVSGRFYEKGQYVTYQNNFYVVKVSHRSGSTFESSYFTKIPSLPIKGGASVQTAVGFDKTTQTKVFYGTIYNTLQEVYDLIIGYGEWLNDQGFIFNQFNEDLQATLNWDYSAKEFLYWTTQNWSDQSVIALSPFADTLAIKFQDSVIDNIFNSFYEYSILEASGQPLPQRFLNVVRDEGLCEIKTNNEYRGIYFARLYSIQKEHAIVFNNRTIFNDSVYDIETGYRQARMKLLGFRTANWNGDYFSPGFVYDTAIISDWKQFTDYRFEDVVRFNGSFYSANKNLPGVATFNFNDWRLLGTKPVAALIPNFDYKISQFEDFYSLDTNNFDEGQQKAAQHLIGYTPRVYLNNIFPDPVAQYKFYQGFIREKGTKNSVIKLQRATVENFNGKIDYNEEWAFRMGYYGSYSTYREIEFPLEEGSFIENPQIIEFTTTTASSTVTNLKIFVNPDDLQIKPPGYKTTETFVTVADPEEDIFKTSIAGYVRYDDVDFTAFDEETFLTNFTDTSVISEGQTIWIANTNVRDWTVLRKTLTGVKLISVEPSFEVESQFNFTTNVPHGFSVGSIINIEEFDPLINGIHRISSVVDKDTFAVINTTTILGNVLQPDNPGLIFNFRNVRYNSFDDLPRDSTLLALPRNSKIWIDDDGNSKWKVYQKIKNYKNYEVISSDSPNNQDLGYNISKQKSTSIYMVGNPGFIDSSNYGNVFVYRAQDIDSSLLFRYGINNSTATTYYDKSLPSGFGSSVFYDTKNYGTSTYGLLVVGAPLASKVSIPAVTTLTETLNEQGLVKISSMNTTTEIPLLVAKSPVPVNNERYGSSVFVANTTATKILVVGAPSTPTEGTGTVYSYVINTGTNIELVSTASISLNYATVDTINIVTRGTGYKVGDILNLTTVTTVATTLTVTVSKVNTNGGILSFIKPYNNSIVYTDVVPGSTLTNITITAVNTATTGTGAVLNLTLRNEVGSQWGYSIAGSEQISFARNVGVVAIGAPGFSLGKGLVTIYTTTNLTTASQYLVSPFENNSNFGQAIAVSPSGSYLAVSAINARSPDQSYGKVAIYRRDSYNQQFTLTQTISNPVPGVGMKFGQSLDINVGDEELVISALGTNRRINLTFDDYTKPWVTTPEPYDNDPNSDFSPRETSYDIDSTYFIDRVVYSGSVYIYNRKNNLFKAADELPPVNVNSGTNYGFSVSVNDSNIFVGAPAVINENNLLTTSTFYQFYKIDDAAQSWKLLRSQEDLVKTDSIQKISLIDTLKDEVIDYLEIVDPLKGKIIGIAEQELSYKLGYDPAVYSVGTNSVVVDINTNWLDEHVGELWWDLSSVKYPWYEQGDLEYRKNHWGEPFVGSTIDVYEWVKTTLLPSQWFALANTPEGLQQGISGEPKYLENNNLSVKQVYNPLSETFTNHYYYWVKNTVIVPATKNRRISAFQVARLIENPRLQGERFVEILSGNALAIANSADLLVDNRINLNIVSDEINNPIPRHTEWILLQENSSVSNIPTNLEKKFVDSLRGVDDLENLVPDPTLSARERYGISIRPRQTMFKNRAFALRNAVEFINGVLIDRQVTGIYSFDNLNKQETPPDPSLGQYDEVVEDNIELESINTFGLETAELTCNVSNGKIVSVTIENSGYGYKQAPAIEIENNVSGAEISATIDPLGRIISVTIENAGNGFVDPPVLTVRSYSVLVLADTTQAGKWSIYSYNLTQATWQRVTSQNYNTSLYWKYVDWIDTTYSKYKDVAYVVNDVPSLGSIAPVDGDYVKVQNRGDGNYIILEKVDANGSFDSDYDVVYIENGTIQLLDTLWKNQTSVPVATTELKYILLALKEDIFINELKLYWNLLFFTSVRYALSEQKLLDWAFKTSFISVTNYAGELKQLPTYKLADTKYYEDYILEAKPYHTQIRSFTTKHSIVDDSKTYITDFDLPPVYDAEQGKVITVNSGSSYLLQYPWKSWADNYGSTDTVRINTITLRYDRITKTPLIDDLNCVDRFVGDGIRSEFVLSWLAQPDNSTIEVYVGNNKVFSTDYSIVYYRADYNGYQKSFSKVVLETQIPEAGQSVRVVYKKNTDLLSAIDRTLSFYAPTEEMPGKDLAQLMIGLEYPRTNLEGISLNYNTRWGNTELGFDNSPYADELSFYTFTVSTASSTSSINQTSIQLADVTGIAAGQVINIISSTSTFFTYSSVYDEPKVVSVNTASNTVVINKPATSTIPLGSKIEFWIYNENPSILDTQYIGGSWEINTLTPVTTASGAIEIDGDRFLNPNSSYAPEELIAGETYDSLGINVYTKAPTQAPIIVASSIDITIANTTTTRQLTVIPPGPQAVIVSLDQTTIFDYVEYSSTGTIFTSSTQYTIDWTYDNGNHPLLIVAPQPVLGKLAYTIMDIGGAGTGNQVGFIDKASVVANNVSFAEVQSLSDIDTVKSAYVTVNGVSIPAATTSTSTFYVLTAVSGNNDRAAAKVYNLPSGSNLVTAWFFGTEQKLWNEIKEEIKIVPKFTKTFTGIASFNSPVITNVNSTDGLVAGVTKVYARTNDGNFIVGWNNDIVSIVGDTVTLSSTVTNVAFGSTPSVEISVIGAPYVEILSTGTWNSVFEFPPENIEPQVANAIIEFKNAENQVRRMLIPPQINYYSVENPNNNMFAITNKTTFGTPNSFNSDMTGIRVYVNGNELRRGFDYILYTPSNLVKIDSSLLTRGDVVAILNKPGSDGGGGQQDYEYDVYENNLRLCASSASQFQNPSLSSFNSAYAGWNTDWHGEIKIITYTNHDHLLMRTEAFDGNSSGRFKISRPILDESYIWVSINGIPLANYVDFEVLDDTMTIQISDSFIITPNDVVTVVSFASNETTNDILGFRIFDDIFNRKHYKRLSKQNSTYLTSPLVDTDSLIYVNDASALTKPMVNANIPGIVTISGERIEFFEIYSQVKNIQIVNPGSKFNINDKIVFSGTNWISELTATVIDSINGGITALSFVGGVYEGLTITSPTTFTSTSGTGTTATFILNLTNNAVLGQLRRGTLGTSPKSFCDFGTDVIDQGTVQTIPYADRILKQNIITLDSVNTYTISTASSTYYYNTGSLSTGTWSNDGITLSNLSIDPANQIDVYYGGRKLNKEYTFHQDQTVSYDSQEIIKTLGNTEFNFTATVAGLPFVTANIGTAYIITSTNQVWVYENSMDENAVAGYVYKGLVRKDPEFSVNTSTQQLTLNIEGGVQGGLRLTVVKREFSLTQLWNNGVSLLDSNTNQAKFLRARPAELPTINYYGI